jgi:hypothetical protein
VHTATSFKALSFRITSCDYHLNINMPKVRVAIDEMAGAKGKVEKASETVGKVERTGMLASFKHYSTSTAQQSLNEHSVARCADAHILNEHAGLRTWAVALYSKLPSPKDLFALITDSSIRPVQDWLHGMSKFTRPVAKRLELTFCLADAGRAERTEQEWQDAVKRAHAKHAFHEHMVC